MAGSADFIEDVRFRILRLLLANPHFSQRRIARELGVSLGTTNYCLNALVTVGFVKVKNFRASANKLGYAYLLTPAGLSEKNALTQQFLVRKINEYKALEAEIEAVMRESGHSPSGNLSVKLNHILQYRQSTGS